MENFSKIKFCSTILLFQHDLKILNTLLNLCRSNSKDWIILFYERIKRISYTIRNLLKRMKMNNNYIFQKYIHRVPFVVQWVNILTQCHSVMDLPLPASCRVGTSYGSDPVLLQLWCRPAAAAPIQPLAWELPYAAYVAVKRPKRKKNMPTTSFLQKSLILKQFPCFYNTIVKGKSFSSKHKGIRNVYLSCSFNAQCCFHFSLLVLGQDVQ